LPVYLYLCIFMFNTESLEPLYLVKRYNLCIIIKWKIIYLKLEELVQLKEIVIIFIVFSLCDVHVKYLFQFLYDFVTTIIFA